MEGWDLNTIIRAAQENARKLRRGDDRLLELKAWVWHFSMHLAYALAQVCSSIMQSERQVVLQIAYALGFRVLKCLQSHGASSGGQQKRKCCDQSVGSASASVHSLSRQVLLAGAYCHL